MSDILQHFNNLIYPLFTSSILFAFLINLTCVDKQKGQNSFQMSTVSQNDKEKRKQISVRGIDLAYVRPGVSFKGYTKVMIDPDGMTDREMLVVFNLRELFRDLEANLCRTPCSPPVTPANGGLSSTSCPPVVGAD